MKSGTLFAAGIPMNFWCGYRWWPKCASSIYMAGAGNKLTGICWRDGYRKNLKEGSLCGWIIIIKAQRQKPGIDFRSINIKCIDWLMRNLPWNLLNLWFLFVNLSIFIWLKKFQFNALITYLMWTLLISLYCGLANMFLQIECATRNFLVFGHGSRCGYCDP